MPGSRVYVSPARIVGSMIDQMAAASSAQAGRISMTVLGGALETPRAFLLSRPDRTGGHRRKRREGVHAPAFSRRVIVERCLEPIQDVFGIFFAERLVDDLFDVAVGLRMGGE